MAFAASCTFRRLGRAMIKPVYNQQYSRTGAVGSALETALRWWLHVLTMGITEHKPWKMPEGPALRIQRRKLRLRSRESLRSFSGRRLHAARIRLCFARLQHRRAAPELEPSVLSPERPGWFLCLFTSECCNCSCRLADSDLNPPTCSLERRKGFLLFAIAQS